MGFVGLVKNIVVSGTRQGSYPILLVFSLVALASPSTGRARAPSPLPPPEVVRFISPSETKKDTRLGVFSFLSRGAEKDAHDFIIKMLFATAKRYIKTPFHYSLLLITSKKIPLWREKSEE